MNIKKAIAPIVAPMIGGMIIDTGEQVLEQMDTEKEIPRMNTVAMLLNKKSNAAGAPIAPAVPAQGKGYSRTDNSFITQKIQALNTQQFLNYLKTELQSVEDAGIIIAEIQRRLGL